MIQITRDESIELRRIFSNPDITRTRFHRYVSEEKKYLSSLVKYSDNEAAKRAIRERYGNQIEYKE